jgi:anti-anti-sigma factor
MDISETKSGGIVILGVKGRIDASNASTLEQKALALIDGGERRLVLDLAQLDYISSAGLRVLLMVAKRLTPRDGKLAIASLKDQVKEVFDIAGFSSIFKIYPTQKDAVAAI